MKINFIDRNDSEVLFKVSGVPYKKRFGFMELEKVRISMHYYNDCVERYYNKEVKLFKDIKEVFVKDDTSYYIGKILHRDVESKNVFINKFIDLYIECKIQANISPSMYAEIYTIKDNKYSVAIQISDKDRDELLKISNSELAFGFETLYGRLVRISDEEINGKIVQRFFQYE